MKVKDLTERFEALGLTGDEDCVQVIESGPVGSGDEWDVFNGEQHLGCLYDDGSGYKYSQGAHAGD